MAGILYLFRLFVNHATYGQKSQDNHDLLVLMEFRLFRYITLPAMVVAWLAGMSMIAVNPVLLSGGWLLLKLLFVFSLTGVTMYAGSLLAVYREKVPEAPSSRSMRYWNEVPTLLMMIIVWLVIFKPF
jgi:putative membrane protein